MAKLSNTGFSLEPIGLIGGADTWRWPGSYGNTLYFGTNSAAANPTEAAALRPEEAWNIDTKMDDAMPATGKLRTHRRVGSWINCTTTNVETTTQYNLTESAIACALLFPESF